VLAPWCFSYLVHKTIGIIQYKLSGKVDKDLKCFLSPGIFPHAENFMDEFKGLDSPCSVVVSEL
jgi:hypothetical protein